MQTTPIKSITNLESSLKPVEVVPTSKHEIWSWIIYDCAKSAFEYIAVDSVFPLFLTYLVKSSGSSYPMSSTNGTALPDFTKLDPSFYVSGTCTDTACVIPWLNTYVRPEVFTLNAMSISVIFYIFFLFTLNAVVENSRYRKMVHILEI